MERGHLRLIARFARGRFGEQPSQLGSFIFGEHEQQHVGECSNHCRSDCAAFPDATDDIGSQHCKFISRVRWRDVSGDIDRCEDQRRNLLQSENCLVSARLLMELAGWLPELQVIRVPTREFPTKFAANCSNRERRPKALLRSE